MITSPAHIALSQHIVFAQVSGRPPVQRSVWANIGERQLITAPALFRWTTFEHLTDVLHGFWGLVIIYIDWPVGLVVRDPDLAAARGRGFDSHPGQIFV